MSSNNNELFAKLPPAASFKVTSSDIAEGQPLSLPQLSGIVGIEGGQDLSPQLAWSGAPEGTKGYAITVFDPDAPTLSGFWHWAVANIPATVTELPTGAGDETSSGLPDGAVQLTNDASLARFIGAAPPAGFGPHRYVYIVHALDVENIGIPAGATPAFLSLIMAGHTLGRAVLIPTAEL